MYLISDNVDTLTGMRLAGVDGIVVHERGELRSAIEHAMEDKEVGVILLTEKFGRKVFVHGGVQPFIRLTTDRTHMLEDSLSLLEVLNESKKSGRG